MPSPAHINSLTAPQEMPGYPEHWRLLGRCAQNDVHHPDTMFVEGTHQNAVVRICAGCPVKTPCLAEGMDNADMVGVWGGKTDRERNALRKRHPNVRSWTRLLAAAEAAYEAGLVDVAGRAGAAALDAAPPPPAA